MFSINIIYVILNTFFFADLLNTYLIEARENFQILENGSDYQGAWPPLAWTITIYFDGIVNMSNYSYR